MTNLEILELKFYCNDLDKEITVKDWLKELLNELMKELDCFRAKYPLGDSNWWHDICILFVSKDLIKGYVKYDEDGDEIESDYDFREFQKIMNELVSSL